MEKMWTQVTTNEQEGPTAPLSFLFGESTCVWETDLQGLEAKSLLLAAWQIYLYRCTGSSFSLGSLQLYSEPRVLNFQMDVNNFQEIAELLEVAKNPPEATDGGQQPKLWFGWCAAGTNWQDLMPELALTADDGAGSIELCLIYNAHHAATEQADRLLQNFMVLLEGILRNPRARIDRLPMVSDPELAKLMKLQGTAGQAPKQSIGELFSEQAQAVPERIAVLDDGLGLSYRELEEKSNQLAHHLIGLGVKPEMPVGLCVKRSLAMTVAMLAILKAGGAYVPLDPAYPLERLRFMAEDAEVNVLITEQELAGQLPFVEQTVFIEGASDWQQQPVTLPELLLSPDNPACIMYTSGSTGTPKGVVIPHRGVVRLVKAANYVSVEQDDVFLQFAPVSFDASIFELFAPLLNGARVVLYMDKLSSLEELIDTIENHGVTTLWLTAGLFHQVAAGSLARLGSVRQWLAGGDVLSAPLVKKVLRELPGAVVINGYGPTENTTFTCCYQVASPEQIGQTVPIGSPIYGTGIHVLDEAMQPVPVGVPGELYVSGEGLALGYLKRPELTAERFVTVEWNGEHLRMYKTGDLVRLQEDGNLEFLGRLDRQVKIRGFRIETGEIEAVLATHPHVRDQAVLVRKDGNGEQALAAYIACGMERLTRQEMHDFLSSRLPEYMLPAHYVFLDAMPLTPNGKIDHKQLPAPFAERAVEYLAPRNETEKAVAAIFADVLGREEIGAEDDFFQFGGHSLSAMQAVSRLRQTFAVQVTIGDLFLHPKVAELSAWLGERNGVGTADEIVTVPRGAASPISSAQARMWFLDQYLPKSGLYNNQIAVRLRGELSREALTASLQVLAERHETLRTSFVEQDGDVLQVTAAHVTVPLLVHQVTGADLDARVQAELHRPFDLSHGPLLRANLFELGPEDHVLLLVVHHIVTDAWSISLLIRELSALYAAGGDPEAAGLGALPVQYADFSRWQRDWLQTGDYEQRLRFWQDHLGEELPALQLPIAKQQAAGAFDSAGAEHRFELSRELTRRLKELSRQEGATLNMTMLTAFELLLSRYSGQKEFVIGTVSACRTRQELEGLIGFFVNTLALRVDLRGDLTFAEALGRVRELWLDVYANQEVPFDKLVETIRPDRELSRTPLFQALFNYLSTPERTLTLDGVASQALDLPATMAKFDLQLDAEEADGKMFLRFEYNRSLYEADAIARMADHFTTLLQSIVEAPEHKLWQFELMPPAEKQQVLIEWNDNALDVSTDTCIHQLFEEQVERTPDAVALIFGEERMTYREFNEQANRLAHHLRGLGVGPDMLVGLCLERTFDLLIGVYGILKAGGAYVPLDPAYPKDRVAMMMEDAQAGVIVTQEKLAADFAATGAQLVCLDRDRALISTFDAGNPDSGVTSHNLGYIIYTSGSTGRPKGVAIEHRNTVAMLQWGLNVFPRDSFRGVFVSTSVCFDVSVFELFAGLLCGGTLIIAQNALALPELPARDLVTQINTVPSAMAELLRVGGVPSSVTVANLGGEPLPNVLAQQVYRELPNVTHVINLYGPSEDTTYSTFEIVEKGTEEPMTVGRPIANTQAYILDEHLQPMPIGVVGQLYLAGAGLARGYLNKPEMTAERYIQNPFGKPGERMYMTGDLARYLPDGRIDCLGRMDHQVKIRGYRVEIGEIETVLGEHPHVYQNAVIARPDVTGNKQLIAFVVPESGAELTAEELTSYLKELVPGYMVPAFFERLDELPLSPNGKINRLLLSQYEISRDDAKQEYAAPRNQAEEVIAGIFAELLGIDKVGIHDHFFDLGGHSLLATRAVSRLRDKFSGEIGMRILFDSPTVAALAAKVSQAGISASEAAVTGEAETVLTRVDDESPLSLSFPQQRLWFLDQLEPGQSLYNVPVCWRLQGELSTPSLEQTFTEIVRRHDVLRTRFATVDGEPMQVIDVVETVPLAVVDLTHLPQEGREAAAWELLTAEALRPFDLAAGPMFRTHLFKLSGGEHLLLVTMHHIASDGWSLAVLTEEMSALYSAYATGGVPQLPELPIRYADYAAWQRSWLQGDVLSGQVAYWKEQLSGVLPVLELPADRPRPAVRTYRGAAARFTVPKKVTDELRAFSKETNATLYMSLLTAFNILLKRCTGLEDILVGSPVAGRQHEEVEHLIGFFINTLVMRTDLSGDPTVRELLLRVREVTLEAYANQDVPFEKLVEEIQPVRNSAHSPLFQVMFVLQNTPSYNLQLPGLQADLLPFALDSAKFDLTWSLEEGDEELLGLVEYNSDLFDAATMERLIGFYQLLLTALASQADRPISHLSLLKADERERMLYDWQVPEKQYPHSDSFQELFEAQASRTPDRLALVFGADRLTYRELNERANALAHLLRQKGVGADTLVGLCVERSPELFVGVLGILKAGGAYVPIDPAYPAERVRFLLQDAQVPVLLTNEPLLELAAGVRADIFCFDRDAVLLAAEPIHNLERTTKANDLAYVIYTSGSTGRPKGAMIEHRSLLNHARALHDAVFAKLEQEGLRISFNAPLAFDSSVKQLGRLLFGDTLFLIGDEMRRDPEQLLRFLEEHSLDHFDCTPSQLSQLIGCGLLDGTPKTVLVGGEAIHETLWQRIAAAEGWRFYNMYGPTECTVNATFCEITPELAKPTLGQALANVQLYVLDERMEPVPYGVTGELYIGGAGLSRGYWERREQTAESFVPHPFGAQGERLYKTGDLMRRTADGRLEFVGRADDQIKIRGFRIEIGEVESALVMAPGLRNATVMAREDASGEKRLVAYVVPIAKQTLHLERIQNHLKKELPAYMMPAHFVVLEKMPVTANGKINRALLPADAETLQNDSYTVPRSSTEETLAAIYAEVLHVERAGAFDHFFERGGHSLLATQAILKIRQAFGIELPLRTLFERPVLAELAAAVEAALLEQADHDRLGQMLEELQNLSLEELQLLLESDGKLE